MVGKTYRVLVDGTSIMKGDKKWKGRTDCNRLLHFKGENDAINLQWHWCDVKVTQSSALAAQGELVASYGRQPPPKGEGVL